MGARTSITTAAERPAGLHANHLSDAYRRSAFPRLGISLQRATTEPALLATLTLLDSIHQRTEKRARTTRAGRYLEASSQ